MGARESKLQASNFKKENLRMTILHVLSQFLRNLKFHKKWDIFGVIAVN